MFCEKRIIEREMFLKLFFEKSSVKFLDRKDGMNIIGFMTKVSRSEKQSWRLFLFPVTSM